ncbi:MAG: AraC family transcriptional regulator [Firmicutes bacterium]|nr:AraC family transcriptional regulator [[Eubacterium] siraeum]MCM1487077.1 AraC family transcriptional regulator [Bacillota bacterium]
MAVIEHAGYYENPICGVSHTHTSCELMCVVSGQAKVSAEGFSCVLTEGCCLLIKSRQLHNVQVNQRSEYKRFIAVINPWELQRQLVRPDLFSMLTDIGRGGFILAKNASSLYGSFERMTRIFQDGGNIYEELSAALAVLSALYEEIKPTEPKAAAGAAKRLSDKTRAYIEQNYAEPIKIADIAASNFVSDGYLSHAFKSETGLSPREYLSHIRCSHAYELIRHTDMRFSRIAANTGFCCANDMSKKIRERYGATPTEIRRGG